MKARLFIIAILISQVTLGQEISPLKGFSPLDYGADSQNWAIDQDEKGIIYVANNAGLLTYNGARWTLYNTPNASAMRSVQVVDEKIYVGFYMEFGYYQKDETGKLIYQSISNTFKNDLLDDEEFWQIEQYKNWILFRSYNRIYLYNTSNESFQYFTSENTINTLSVLSNGIYYQKAKEGIFTLIEGNERLVYDNSLIKENKLIRLFEHQNGLLAVTDKAGIYLINSNVTSIFNNELNELLNKSNSVYTAIRLKDKKIAIGTVTNGLIVIDENGNIETQINQELGLTNNTVLSIFEGKKSLWLGTDHGLNFINTNASLKIYTDHKGRIGTVYDAVKKGDYLYLGTNQGLFYSSNNDAPGFELIPNTSGQVWSLFENNGTLFCGHDAGTFRIEGEQAIKIADIAGTWLFREVPNRPDYMLQGNYDGIHVLKKTDDLWKYQNKINGFNFSSQFFEISGNKIIVNHEFNGVFEMSIDSELKEFTNVTKIEKFNPYQSAGLVKYNDQIYFASNQGFYHYNNGSGKFQKNDSVSAFIAKDFVSGRMSITDQGIWIFANESIKNLKYGQVSAELELQNIAFPTSLFSAMKGFQKLTKIDENNYLVGSTNRYTLLNKNNKANFEHEVFINGIRNYNNDRSVSKEMSTTSNLKFRHDLNSFEINYSSPNYNAVNPVKYQTRLVGRGSEWSDWSSDSSYQLENLASGDYSFQVRSRVGNSISTNTAKYSFTIQKPWYGSNLAILIYALLGFLIATTVHGMYQRYFKKQKQLLLDRSNRELSLKEMEANQKINDIEKNQLESDITNKNRELAISTMSLIKKNKVLSDIKKELLAVDDEQQIKMKPVIKIIDENLNNNNDWEFFEEAFNNADRDFLKKIQALHPKLTPNDLRLCAYLRLNLSSKEVAPLLNISPRSVEIKRYRLRKKMNLAHEKSLVNYILQV